MLQGSNLWPSVRQTDALPAELNIQAGCVLAKTLKYYNHNIFKIKQLLKKYYGLFFDGADYRNWTYNLLITIQLLCQIELSRHHLE